MLSDWLLLYDIARVNDGFSYAWNNWCYIGIAVFLWPQFCHLLSFVCGLESLENEGFWKEIVLTVTLKAASSIWLPLINHRFQRKTPTSDSQFPDDTQRVKPQYSRKELGYWCRNPDYCFLWAFSFGTLGALKHASKRSSFKHVLMRDVSGLQNCIFARCRQRPSRRDELQKLLSTLSQVAQRVTALGWRAEAIALYLCYFFLL